MRIQAFSVLPVVLRLRSKLTLLLCMVGVTLLASAGPAPSPGVPSGGGRGAPSSPLQPHPFELPGTPIVAASSDGYLPSTWSVTPSGQFTYSIPLSVPAGRAGMQPSLGLSYSSGGGNGLLGVGWSLAGGGSAITRCGRSLPVEGRVDGVDFSAADRFCLDGQKLIAVGGVDYGSGEYGDIDTQYRTETDSFAQIISTGVKTQDGKGPELFIVNTKSGHRLTYTAVEAMRIATTLDGTVTELGSVRVEWLLSSEEDRLGNAITYEYNSPMQGSGKQAGDYALDIRLLHIRYTGNLGQNLLAYRHVDLVYEDRPSTEVVPPQWQSGIAHRMPARLKTLAMYAPNPTATALVWQYNLSYQPSVATNRSQLIAVQQCSAAGGCAWTKQFEWTASTAAPQFVTNPILPAPLYPNFQDPNSNPQESPTLQVLDLNGDGAQDLVYHPGSFVYDFTVPNYVLLGKRGLTGAFVPLSDGPYTAARSENTVDADYGHVRLGSGYPIDLTASGQVDLFAQVETDYVPFPGSQTPCMWWTKHWNDTTKKFERTVPGLSCEVTGSMSNNDPIYHFPKVLFADLDGDGLVEMIHAENANRVDPKDPDSPPDIELGYDPQWRVRFNRNNGHAGSLSSPSLLTGKPFANGKPNGLPATCAVRVTDMDGDGRGDMITCRKYFDDAVNKEFSIATALSTGDSGSLVHKDSAAPATNDTWGKQSFSIAQDSTFYGDFNGDGLEDYVVIPAPSVGDGQSAPSLVKSWIYWNTGKGYYPGTDTVDVPTDVHPDRAKNLTSAYADRGIRVVDINRDGRADLVVFHNDPTPMVTLLLSQGDGTFQRTDMPLKDAGTRMDGKHSGGAAFPHFNTADQNWYGYDPADLPGMAPGWTLSQVGDFNGDGFPDIVRHVGDAKGGFQVLQQSAQFSDRLAAVYDQKTLWPREQISYSSEWSDHPNDNMNYSCSYPLRCIRGGLTVVRAVTSRTHLVDPASAQQVADGGHTLYYSYEDPVADAQQGFLGFAEFRVWDPAQPAQTITTFDQRTRVDVTDNPNNPLDGTGSYYPYAGIPQTVTTIVPILTQAEVDAQTVTKATARFSKTTYSYDYKRLNGGATHVVLPDTESTDVWEQSTSMRWKIGTATPYHFFGYLFNTSGAPSLHSDTYQQFDDYGNLTYQEGKNSSGAAVGEYTTQSMTYENRIADWLIGLPLAQETHSMVPGDVYPGKARHINYHHNALGQLDTLWREQGGSTDVAATTTMTYSSTGQLGSTSTTVANEVPRTTHVEYGAIYPGAPMEQIYPSQTWAEHSNPDCPAGVDCRPSQWYAVHPVYGVLASMDVNGVQTTVTYDGLGRPATTRTDGEEKVFFGYGGRKDAFGGLNGLLQVTTLGDPLTTINPPQTTVYRDARGNPLSSVMTGFDGKPIQADAHYDLRGRLTRATRPYLAGVPTVNGAMVTSYDSLGRVMATQMPDSSSVTHTYPSLFESHHLDAGNNGNVNESYTLADMDGHVITSANMLILPSGVPGVPPIKQAVKTTFHYGAFGAVDSITDPANHATVLGYDVLGRKTSTSEPDRGTTTTAYNGFGEIRQVDSPALIGQTQISLHDDLGRVISQITPDGTTTLTYDTSAHGVGRLDKAISADKIVTGYRYDALGRAAGMDLTDEAQRVYSVDMSYNAQTGRLVQLAYPQAPGRARFTAQYQYNAMGMLNEVDDATPGQPLAPLWHVDARNPEMALLDGTLGNGTIALHRDYDAMMGRLKTQTAQSAGANLLTVGYDYWANGLVKTRNSNDGAAQRTEAFDYDGLQRLTTWKLASTYPNGPLQVSTPTGYQYDLLGNLTDISRNGALLEHRSYGKNGSQPHTLTNLKTYAGANIQSDVSYAYDALGRMEQDATRKIGYSALDLPKTLTRNGQSWTVLYDAMGSRIAKSGPEGTTHYLPGLYERRQVGKAITHVFHVSGTDGAVAQVNYDEPLIGVLKGSTSVVYPISDALGSTSVVVDAKGNIIEREYYDPFGARINTDGTAQSLAASSTVKDGFTGQEHDDAFGLINFKGRMYDPAMKRFLSADPIVSAPGFSQAWNPYSYVMNSPLNLTDPSGFETCTVGHVVKGDDGSTTTTTGCPALGEGQTGPNNPAAVSSQIRTFFAVTGARDQTEIAKSDDAGHNLRNLGGNPQTQNYPRQVQSSYQKIAPYSQTARGMFEYAEKNNIDIKLQGHELSDDDISNGQQQASTGYDPASHLITISPELQRSDAALAIAIAHEAGHAAARSPLRAYFGLLPNIGRKEAKGNPVLEKQRISILLQEEVVADTFAVLALGEIVKSGIIDPHYFNDSEYWNNIGLGTFYASAHSAAGKDFFSYIKTNGQDSSITINELAKLVAVNRINSGKHAEYYSQ